MYLFPDKEVSRNYKTKERAVEEYVRAAFPDHDIIADRRVEGGCSGRRPDIFLDLGDQVVIVETDENQHESYDCSCENKRLMQIWLDVGSRPIVFIRFNPDEYYDETGKKVPSCWKHGKDGIMRIRDERKWSARMEALKAQITYWIEHRTDKEGVEVVQLFYDLDPTTGTATIPTTDSLPPPSA
jgi:hypothetical protein